VVSSSSLKPRKTGNGAQFQVGAGTFEFQGEARSNDQR
jgi:hypothetical protein